MEKLGEIIFYTIDKSIRSYRIYAQKQLRSKGFKMTIDQWLIIRCIMENPNISQQEMGEIVFKDNASVTRMIELLVKGGYLSRKPHPRDRRRVELTVTRQGKKVLEEMQAVVVRNRQHALAGITPEEIQMANKVLGKIIANCQPEPNP